MVEIDISEAQQRFDELVERANAGEAFHITQHGQVVARIVPAQTELTRAERAERIAALIRARDGVTLEGGPQALRDLINEGRRY